MRGVLSPLSTSKAWRRRKPARPRASAQARGGGPPAPAGRQVAYRLQELAAEDLALGDGVRVDSRVVVRHLHQLLGGAVDGQLRQALQREDADAAGPRDGEELWQGQAQALGQLSLRWRAAEVGVEGRDGLFDVGG